jgi:hypothetical protein
VEPPFTGVAVKVTGLPEQTGFDEGDIVTETGNNGFTIMLIVFDVAGLFEEQVSSDVRIQKTRSPVEGI